MTFVIEAWETDNGSCLPIDHWFKCFGYFYIFNVRVWQRPDATRDPINQQDVVYADRGSAMLCVYFYTKVHSIQVPSATPRKEILNELCVMNVRLSRKK